MKLDKESYYESLCPINKGAFSIFEKYKRDASSFIECGCHLGNTCEKAVHLGYSKIYSCDIDESRVQATRDKLSIYDVPYKIEHKDSLSFLGDTLPVVKDRSTLWLDAHSEGGGVPLFEELGLIKKVSHRNDHHILIDDIQIYFKNDLDKIKKYVRDINPNYVFEEGYIHNQINPDILICYTK